MDSNTSYRVRKDFSEEDAVEEVEYKKVSAIPGSIVMAWGFESDRHHIKSYPTGGGASLIVFDYPEGVYSYWAGVTPEIHLEQRLKQQADNDSGLFYQST